MKFRKITGKNHHIWINRINKWNKSHSGNIQITEDSYSYFLGVPVICSMSVESPSESFVAEKHSWAFKCCDFNPLISLSVSESDERGFNLVYFENAKIHIGDKEIVIKGESDYDYSIVNIKKLEPSDRLISSIYITI